MYEISEDLNKISMKSKPGPQFHTNRPVSSTDVQINAPSLSPSRYNEVFGGCVL
jgi:hypothetical protein